MTWAPTPPGRSSRCARRLGPAAQAFLESADIVIALDNDIYSYRKESEEGAAPQPQISLEDAVAETVVVRDRISSLFLRRYDKLRPTASEPMRYLHNLDPQIPYPNIAWWWNHG
ncbi:terpene synthase family protein [Amycolatopsis anabasis]|uniref:terpene synthase family protein n=1 Tax=Amycolatopsis anabasis TaxID=1840409 RepID=UPI00131B2C32|nr:terpene synthase family protein [Amycolatopsis anabasis]